jgi:two-component system cell cycle sensor histidine kinase/response regulator CckA
MDGSEITYESLLEELTFLRKRVEELEAAGSRAEEIVSAMGDGISIQSPGFRVLYQNKTHEDMVGGSMVGRLCYEAYAHRTDVCPGCPVKKALGDGGTHRLQKTLPAPNEATHLEIVASPLRDSSGKTVAGIEIVRDITERKEVERKVAEAHSRLETLVETIPYAVFFKDPQGRHLVINEACRRFFGLPKDDIIGRTAEELLPPETAAVCNESDGRVLGDRASVRLEETFMGGSGEAAVFETIKTPLLSEEGGIEGLVGISFEITQRKNVEEVLGRLKERYQSIIDDLPDMVCRYRADTTIIFVNEAYARYFGKTPKELIGTSFLELVPPEDHDYILGSIASLSLESPLITTEHKVISPGGGERWQLWRDRALFDEEGNVTEIQAVGQDVTERRQAEEKLRRYQAHLEEMVRERTAELTAAVELLQEQMLVGRQSEAFIRSILESIDESLVVLDADYRVLSANRAFCEHAGLPLEEAKGRHCYELLHMSASPCFEEGGDCSARRVFESGEPSSSTHTHTDGEKIIYVETKTYPMRDEHGRVNTVIQVIHDVTERRKLEEQLRHSQKMEAIGQLAGGVAHDFNNRLAAITNYAYIVKTKLSPDDPLLVHVNSIMSSAERAAHLTQNLLTFSRKHVMDPRPVKLNDVVRGVEKLIARSMGGDIELRAELSSDELVVMADTDQMEHVLINLATNARDAIPGSGRVSISTSRVELGRRFFEGRSANVPGSYVMIAFRDSGGGMSEETKAKIFEPFFTTKAVGKGTGLGLSIVYGIIKQHKGFIDVESSPGEGTAFHLYLPLLASRATHAAAREAPPPAKGSETVLLAEDDDDVRRPLKQMLEEQGYEVIEATNGPEAVERFLQSRKKVGLLMLDVILPAMNGVEVLKEIRKVEPGIRAIFTSGYSEEQIRRKGLLEPGTTFLSKPVTPEVLLQKVREAIDR